MSQENTNARAWGLDLDDISRRARDVLWLTSPEEVQPTILALVAECQALQAALCPFAVLQATLKAIYGTPDLTLVEARALAHRALEDTAVEDTV